jgi:hypothetical protein
VALTIEGFSEGGGDRVGGLVDALLPAWRRRRDTPRLSEERVVDPAEIDLDRWRLDLQILAQTARAEALIYAALNPCRGELGPAAGGWSARAPAGACHRGVLAAACRGDSS